MVPGTRLASGKTAVGKDKLSLHPHRACGLKQGLTEPAPHGGLLNKVLLEQSHAVHLQRVVAAFTLPQRG